MNTSETTALPETPPTAGQLAPSPELLALVRRYWDVSYGDLGSLAVGGALDTLNRQRALEELEQVVVNAPFPLPGKRLLDIGCGVGTLQLVARQRGIDALGIEPEVEGARAGRQMYRELGLSAAPILCAAGEGLPFPDESFDVICSFQVLEHTRDPRQVLQETVRVLKSGGCFVHVFPSYGSFWEGHYGVPWIPYLPKRAARWYLRWLGYPISTLEGLQLLNPITIYRLLKDHPNIIITNWGLDLWEHRVRTLEFSEWAHLGRLKRLVRWLHWLRLVPLAVGVGRLCHFETPIVLVGVKAGAPARSSGTP